MNDSKNYVKRDDKDNPFPDGEADFVNCKNCGQALLLRPGSPPVCPNGCSPEN